MRRLLVLAAAILALGAPSANAASSVHAHAITVTPTHAVIQIDAWTVAFSTADVSVEYGPTKTYGTKVVARTAQASGGPATITPRTRPS